MVLERYLQLLVLFAVIPNPDLRRGSPSGLLTPHRS